MNQIVNQDTTRSVCLPAGFFHALHRRLAGDVSPQQAATLLREVGYETGEPMYDALLDWFANRDPGSALHTLDADRFWSAFSDYFEEVGWGTLRAQQPHSGIAELESANWAEAGEGDESGMLGCHLSTGLFSALLRRVADADVAVMEVECRSAGSPRCRFLFGGQTALTAVYERIQAGADAARATADLA